MKFLVRLTSISEPFLIDVGDRKDYIFSLDSIIEAHVRSELADPDFILDLSHLISITKVPD